MRIIICGICTLLIGCQSLTFPAADHAKHGDGVQVRRVTLTGETPLTCYTEIQNDALSGVSCQNNLAVTVFSAGHQHGKIILQKTVPFFQQHQAQTVIDALTLILFTNANLATEREYTIKQANGKMQIFHRKALIAEVTQ